ncbi:MULTISPECIES: SDR family oxidoreductase [unclassified Corallococcus]|uniref:SDR family oxidoreductase n=1 Tax=unclassified Corallococcus TaxID=2685029 RepID=UPI001A8C967B|nr:MULTISPECIES: SDR family oxidoreductase [unclassified Corallococcus]MBN9682422.1 SDR family oxidoreductase [Corallococcus sp. NCSPR001]WAS86024.1 SDR family oxidoreductase [Corallococcus sp. NCRR]
MTHRLEGKVALVTGAGSGIGRATALALAREGARVVAAGRRVEPLEETVRMAGGHVVARAADVTKEDDVEALVRFTLETFGRLDVGVNAAGGTFGGGPTHTLDTASFREWIDGYLVSAFLSTKHEVAAMLKSGGGSVINIGTFVGHTKAIPGTSGYAAAKTGLIGLTRTVAAEYAPQGIRANVLVSGGADTPMFRLWNGSEEQRAAAARLHALQRVANPEEIANAAVFLASGEASFVTGSVLTADGGVSLG